MPLNFDRLRTLNLGGLRLNNLLTLKTPLLRFRDPTAESIAVEVIDAERARFRVTGTIRNRGTLRFEGNENQAGVYLYRDGQLVAHTSFAALDPGERLSVIYEFNGPGGDIPPTFKLMIGYDPDIFIDGNPNNDDMVTTNNTIERGVNLHDVLRDARA